MPGFLKNPSEAMLGLQGRKLDTAAPVVEILSEGPEIRNLEKCPYRALGVPH